MKRIGISGGTFNPIHLGHLFMAQTALEKFDLEKVIFVPSCWPPHKSRQNVLGASQRLKMVRLAVKDNPFFEASDVEIKRGGKSYTIDTLRYFRRQYPADTQFFFILGYDSFADLHRWHQINELLKITSFIVINRPGFKPVNPKIPKSKVFWTTMPGLEISSSYLRRAIISGKTIKYLIPDPVLAYIKENNLYQKY